MSAPGRLVVAGYVLIMAGLLLFIGSGIVRFQKSVDQAGADYRACRAEHSAVHCLEAGLVKADPDSLTGGS